MITERAFAPKIKTEGLGDTPALIAGTRKVMAGTRKVIAGTPAVSNWRCLLL